jgi:hypothetical protein
LVFRFAIRQVVDMEDRRVNVEHAGLLRVGAREEAGDDFTAEPVVRLHTRTQHVRGNGLPQIKYKSIAELYSP